MFDSKHGISIYIDKLSKIDNKDVSTKDFPTTNLSIFHVCLTYMDKE